MCIRDRDFVVQDSDEESASESESSDDGADAEGEAEEASEGACNQEQRDGGGTSSNADGTAADWSSQKSDNLMKRLKRLKDMHIEDSCKTVCCPMQVLADHDMQISSETLTSVYRC